MFFFIVSGSLTVRGQLAPDTYWVQFTDKNNSPYQIDNPSEFLSERAVSRRQKQNISITKQDLPVNGSYVDSLRNLGIYIHNVSKWLNGAVIVSSDLELLDTLHHISFVANKLPVSEIRLTVKSAIDKFPPLPKSSIDYGESENQVMMLNGKSLHSMGFEGEGMLIAVLDAGFTNSKEIESLKHLWDEGKIIASRDFVKDNSNMFTVHTHGTIVFSIIAGVIPGNIYGTAPKADFVLLRTENGATEYLVEEYNWISGAEYADSIGVDIINSSLGYSLFDNPEQDHTYEDMDGKSTPISIGATIAASKGMLVVTSAGNSGDDPWRYITAPADADSVLGIGAVDPYRVIAGFSGRGPSYDGRIKPDISAQGVYTVGQTEYGALRYCNGTSCSSPLMAGMAACLWQSRPHASAQDIRNAIIEASDRYSSPDTIYGYGIPNMLMAQNILDSIAPPVNDLTQILVYPNPVPEVVRLTTTFPWLNNPESGLIEIYDVNGRLLISTIKDFNKGITIHPIEEVLELEHGFYMLRLIIQGRTYKVSFIKQ